MDYLDYVFSINPYSPAMSKVEEDFAYYGSIEVDGSLWDQIGKIEQLIWLARYMIAEMERRLEDITDKRPYIVGPLFQLRASLTLLLQRGALITSEYICKNQNLKSLENLAKMGSNT